MSKKTPPRKPDCFSNIHDRAELIQELELVLHWVSQRNDTERLVLSEASRLSRLLEKCLKLAGQAFMIPIALDLLERNAEAKRVAKETGNPRAGGRVMGWTTGKREHPDDFILNLHQYVDLLEQGKSKADALSFIIEEQGLHSYEAAYKRLKEARKAEIKRLTKAGPTHHSSRRNFPEGLTLSSTPYPTQKPLHLRTKSVAISL